VKTTLIEASPTERVLEIEVPREKLDKIFDEKVKKYSREIRMNGFRPGNVPKHVVIARFKEPISAESLESLVDEAVREACKEKGVDPIGPGRVEKLDNEEGKPIFVKAILEVDPPVELKEYRFDIPVDFPKAEDAAVEERIQGLCRQLARETPLDRPAALGDTVVARYQRLQIDGQDQPIPQYPVFRVDLGKGSIPELDQALVGVKAGDVKDVAFTFPKDYSNPSLAGRPSAYVLNIEQVLEVKLPELDEAAKSLGHENPEALRAFVRVKIEEASLQKAKEAAWEEGVRRLLDNHRLEVPKARIQNYVRHRLEEMGHHHAEGEEHNHDHSDLEHEAEFQIRRWRLIDAIAAKEGIKPAQEDVDARIRRMAGRYGTDFEGLKASLRKSGKILDLREEVKAEKTLDFIIGYKTPA
jgi:trigger factor